jgi:hypothetical protein
MRSVACWPVLWIALGSVLAGCVASPDEESPGEAGESSVTSSVVTSNRITGNRITGNRVEASRVAASRLATAQLASGRFKINMAVAGTLLATADGREVFSLIVNCALPGDMTLVGTVAGTMFEFPGELGLAPQWKDAALDPIGQHWVSACIFSRINARDVALPISVRGPHPALATTRDERAAFPLEEGAFFGNLFVPLIQPIQWFACRGKDQARGETGGLVDRDCTEPDPAHPGLTQCGFFFAGDCGDFAAKRSCEDFSQSGRFYERCHAQPFRLFPGLGDRVFPEVITTFVTP